MTFLIFFIHPSTSVLIVSTTDTAENEEVYGLRPGEAPHSDFLDLGLSVIVTAVQQLMPKARCGCWYSAAGKRWNRSLLACLTIWLV